MRLGPEKFSVIAKLKLLILFAAVASMLIFSTGHLASNQDPTQNKTVDPKAWGSNHVGKPIPEYVTGDECLFCHRYDVGQTWQKNSHGVAIRRREDAPDLVKMLDAQPALAGVAKQVEYFMGSRRRVRFLRENGYGKFAILTAQADLGEEGQAKPATRVIDGDKPTWDKEKFAPRCAGCHTTAFDSKAMTFSAFGHDCYVCHGDVDVNHSKDTSLVLLSKKRRNDAKVITSLCAQCHLRESRSRSTGLPFPNTFIAGDNLFQDLEVDWAKADDQKLNAGDRHVWRNVRDVALYGNESITCLSCHQVHGSTSLKHRRILRAPICSECHQNDGFKEIKRYVVHSSLCEY
jgi:predicted CXXCH cytochrome family protein